ncbi:hypothetical protein [Chryseobacterium takakiae]|uniref:Uncharacterized protein n=1 Tax=Chryseobacterium takakiae TaxID=1302685 RepID=A0A1M4UQT7_9FLAO|nr:hypothetical protein [Chryseobacterium takakiae]SHE59018.1 hypothetical protein SAMN05444408_102247 [Chryseobacterium takakiae]
MTKKDIEELLEHCSNKIEEIKKSETISKVDVKNILENLRSSLEYCAQYINYTVYNKKSKIYFPYGKTEDQFKKSINRNFLSLKKKNPKIYKFIEDLQPHILNDNWLVIMCEATNEAKHNNALNIENQIDVHKKITVDIPGVIYIPDARAVTFKGNYIDDKPIDDFVINNDTIEITKKGLVTPQFNFEIVENKTFLLKDYQCDLIQLLEKSLKSIREFSNNLYNNIN